MGCVVVAAEAWVILPLNHCVERVIAEALLLLLVAQYPGVPVWMVVMVFCCEGGGTVANKGAGGDEQCTGLVRLAGGAQ